MLVLWIKAPLNSAGTVFTHFTDSGSWSSTGLSVMVGQITAIYGLVGPSIRPLEYPSIPW